VAQRFVREGVHVVMVARSKRDLEARAAELGGPDRAMPVAFDLSSAAAAAECIAQVLDRLGETPDVVVNNAGAFSLSPIEDTAIQDFDRTLALNVSVPFAIVQALLPSMKGRARGHVITIGSIADRRALPQNSAYAASKFALRGLHEVLREETRGSGIRVSLVSPGPVDTALWNEIDPDTRPGFTPRRQMLSAENVAAAVWFVASQPAAVNVDELRLSHT